MKGHNTALDYYTYQGPEGHGQYDGQGVYCDPSTASEVFPIFTTQLYSRYAVHILTRGKYCNRNSPNSQYFPLLTSGG